MVPPAPLFTILDCETTGLRPEYGHQIIEVALLLCEFKNGKLLERDRFESLVNPGVSLDERISFITGIKDEDLQNAPKIGEIKERVLSFFSTDTTIVGHNVEFDINFLKNSGVFEPSLFLSPQQVKADFPSLDTLDLAFLFEDSGLSLSLESLTGRYEIEHASHRAMGDVLATKKILEIYLAQIRELDPTLQSILPHILENSAWSGKSLFPLGQKKDLAESFHQLMADISKRDLPSEPAQISSVSQDKEKKNTLFPERQELYDLVRLQLEQNKRSIIAVSAGSGKTFAGLKAGVDFAEKSEEKVLYLYPYFNQDVQECVELFSEEAVLPYQDPQYILSLPRLWELVQSKTDFTQDETLFLFKIFYWLLKTRDGYLKEIHFPYPLRVYLPLITGRGPRSDMIPDIFLERYQYKYEHARVLLLRYTDFFWADKKQFSAFNHLIFENGALLEDQLLYANTTILSLNRFTSFIEAVEKIFLRQTQPDELSLQHLSTLKEKIPFLFGYLGILAQQKREKENNEMLVENKHRSSLQFEKVKYAAQATLESLAALQVALGDDEQYQEQNLELVRIQKNLRSLLQDEPGIITFLDMRNDVEIVLKRTDLEVEKSFRAAVENKKSVVIFTSPNWDLQTRLDLKEFEKKQLAPKKGYQITSYLVEDVRVSSSPGYTDTLQEIVAEIAKNKKEKVVFIFSSTHLIEQVVLRLSPAWKEQNIPFLAQKISGGEKKVLERYAKQNFTPLFFCTTDFFIKMTPRNLQANLFVVQKIPFAYTLSVVDSFRKQKYRNEFMEYALPKTLVRFEELIGNIVKAPAPNKQLLVLDSKMATEEYGKYFRALLPSQEETYIVQSGEISSLLSKQ